MVSQTVAVLKVSHNLHVLIRGLSWAATREYSVAIKLLSYYDFGLITPIINYFTNSGTVAAYIARSQFGRTLLVAFHLHTGTSKPG